jgi:hypothetical protein
LIKFITKNQVIFEPEKFVAHKDDYIVTDFKNFLYCRYDGSLLYKSSHHFSTNIIAKTKHNTKSFKEAFYLMLTTNNLDCQFLELTNNIYQKTKKGIIIGGCGRSGTTLLLSILSCHPLIDILEETFSFYPSPMRLHDIEKMISKSSGIWCEKTPKNVLVFDKIKSILKEKCKIVHMVRDGRAVITSKHPSNPNSYWVPIERWVKDVSIGLECKDAKIIKYEDLAKNPEETIRKLLEYLELDFDKKLLSHEKYGIKNSNAWSSSVQIINTKSIDKWRHESHKKIIDNFMKNKSAVLLLERLGYDI